MVGYVTGALSYPIGFQRVHITLGNILSFLFILVVGYALANLLAFALRKLLVSRFPLQRGLHIRSVAGTTGETVSVDDWPISDLKRRTRS